MKFDQGRLLNGQHHRTRATGCVAVFSFSGCFKDGKEMAVSGMRKHYMVEVGLKGSSLRIEAND